MKHNTFKTNRKTFQYIKKNFEEMKLKNFLA